MHPSKGVYQISANVEDFNKTSLQYLIDYIHLLSSTPANLSLRSHNNLPPAVLQICPCKMLSLILKNCEK